MPTTRTLVLISFIPLLILPLIIFFNADKLEDSPEDINNRFIPMNITVEGTVYDMEDIDVLISYHGAEAVTIVVDRKFPNNNGVWFYRNGLKHSLFTLDAISYLKGRR